MNANYLFPNRLKKIGWLIFIPSTTAGVLYLFPGGLKIVFNMLGIEEAMFKMDVFAIIANSKRFVFISNNVFDEILGVFIIIGAILIAFSKERTEDEFIARMRLESLVWATYVNYIVLIISILFVYDQSFLTVMILNMFTTLIFFLIKFHWMVYKAKRGVKYEE